jgi:hypothetical protein
MKHMQMLLLGKRKYIKVSDIPNPHHTPPYHLEFSCKALMNSKLIPSDEQRQYFPTLDPKKIDRQFVYDIFKTLRPSLAEQYYQKVLDIHIGNRLQLKKTNDLHLSDSTMDLLLKYDHLPVSQFHSLS